MDKRTLAQLVDAYADAKLTKNPYLINLVASQLEMALDLVFPEKGVEEEEEKKEEL